MANRHIYSKREEEEEEVHRSSALVLEFLRGSKWSRTNISSNISEEYS